MAIALALDGTPLANAPLMYRECGLDDVYLLNGYEVHQTPYGDGISVENVEGLHEAIALNLVRNKGLLKGKEVRFIRKLLGWTQADLARRLRCNVQSVARWESGKTEINGPADMLTRAFFLGSKNKNLQLLEFANEVAELNIVEHPQYFRETSEGWQPARAA